MIRRAAGGLAVVLAGAVLYWGLMLADALGPAWQIVRHVMVRDEPHGATQVSLLGVLVALALVGIHALGICKLLRWANVSVKPAPAFISSSVISCLVIAIGHPRLLPSLLAGEVWLSYEWFAGFFWPNVLARYNEYGAVLPFRWFMFWHTALQAAALLGLVAFTNVRRREPENGHQGVE